MIPRGLLFLFLNAEAWAKHQDLWVWASTDSPLHGDDEAAAFLDFAANQTAPFGTALIEDEKLATNSSALQSFTTRAAKASPSVSVAPLYGWSGSSAADVPAEKILSWVKAAAYLRSAQLAKKEPAIVGISLDVEPKQEQQYQQYADLLQQIRETLDARGNALGGGLRVGIAAAWGFDLHNVTCPGKGNMSLMHCAIGLVDRYVLMNYRNSAHGCACKPNKPNPPKWGCVNGSVMPAHCDVVHYPSSPSKDGMIGKALDTAQAIVAGARARLALGVETSCGIGPYTYKLSFCGTNVKYLREQQLLTEQWFSSAGLWDAVVDKNSPWVVEDYKALQKLELGIASNTADLLV